ncbi:MAG: leucine-rich repeat domain-containing protein [Acholeplasmatales bacterium]|nr:leucine-rich repeat domain-containing protein [Acholeplasmatales bacterium]
MKKKRLLLVIPIALLMFGCGKKKTKTTSSDITNRTTVITTSRQTTTSSKATTARKTTSKVTTEAKTMFKVTVEHYFENLDGSYEKDESLTEIKEVREGETYSGEVQSGEGFHKNSELSTSCVVSSNEKENIVKIYYARDSYCVSIDQDNGEENILLFVKHGGLITDLPEVTKEGYDFSCIKNADGTDLDLTIPVTSDVYLKAFYTPSTNTKYIVKYYFENIEDDNYTEDETLKEEKTGTTGEEASIEVKPSAYDGFTYNDELSETSGEILPDGSLELSIYYARERYDINFYSRVNGTVELLDTLEDLKYCSVLDTPAYDVTGYHVSYYEVSGLAYTSFAAIESVEGNKDIYIQYAPNTNTEYKVLFYKENLDGTFTLEADDTESYTGTTLEEVQYTVDETQYDHFTYDSELSTTEGVIAPDGSLELKVYFKRETYDVRVYQYYDDDYASNYHLVLETNVKYGTKLERYNNDPVGYHITYYEMNLVDYDSYDDLGIIEEYTEITYFYDENTDTVYKVNVYIENLYDDDYGYSYQLTLAGTTNASVNGSIQLEDPHFIFQKVENTIEDAPCKIAPDGSTVLNAYYKRIKTSVYFNTNVDGVTIDPYLSVKYGQKINRPTVDLPGYELTKFVYKNTTDEFDFDNDTINTSSNVYLTAIFTEIDTTFKVIHHYQNVEDDEYTTVEETLTALTNSVINVDDLIELKTGYHYQSYGTNSSRILNTGETVVNIYYHLDTFRVKIVNTYMTTTNEEFTEYTDIKYGTTIAFDVSLANINAYNFTGIFIGDEKVGESTHYEFTLTENITINIGAEVKPELSNFTFTIKNGGVQITGVKEQQRVIHIPDCVSYIYSAFYYDDVIEEVYISYNVLEIGTYSFTGCSNLKKVHIGENSKLEAIGQDAFSGSGITDIDLPHTLKTIGKNAFSSTKLNSVTIPSTVTSIGQDAFLGTTIGILEFESGIAHTYGNQAFNQVSCGTLILPDSINTLTANSFKSFRVNVMVIGKNLATIEDNSFDGSVRTIINKSDLVLEIGSTDYSSIARYAVRILDSMENITILDNYIKYYNNDGKYELLAYFGDEAYVIIDDGIDVIGNYAFMDNQIINRLKLSDSVTTIGERAFYNCRSLFTVEIGIGLQEILSEAFMGNTVYEINNLSQLDLVMNSDTYGYIAYNTRVITSDVNFTSKVKVYYDEFVTFEISSDDCSLIKYLGEKSNIVIPEEITKIESGVFYYSYNLKTITIGKNVKTLDMQAFYGCSYLTSVIFEEGSVLTEIGANAFYSCTSLKSIVLPESYTEVGNYAFSNSSLTSITFSSQTTKIGGSAFSNNTKLQTIVIPDSVTEIGNYAFYGCTALTKVVLGPSIETIGYGMFNNISGNIDVFYKGSQEDFNDITIGSNNTKLTDNVYYYSEEEQEAGSRYWHYVDGVETKY